ncbi:MAG: AAA family ATPase [Melioribacteraceae bacterium]|nr:AAA family ATPase [Melioribacteraceae bacterium]
MALLKAKPRTELSPNDLKWTCDVSKFDFDSTSSLKPLEGIIGQERALKALKLGVDLRTSGYNVFITGLSGTGKFTTVKTMLETLRPKCPELNDYAYVNNFKDPDRPLLLMFPAGKAKKFKKDLSNTIKFLQDQIPKTLESPAVIAQKKNLMVDFSEKQQTLMGSFETKLKKNEFTLGQVKIGEAARPEILAIIEEKPVFIQQLDEYVSNKKITRRKANTLTKKYASYQQELQSIVQKSLILNQEFQDKVITLEKESVAYIVEGAIEDLKSKFKIKQVTNYLTEVQKNILQTLDVFKGHSQEKIEENNTVYVIDYLKDYDVNIILDNAGAKDWPVIIETTPSYTNIFGTIEKYSDGYGGWHADFTRIKAGSLLRANGGYLVINAIDAYQEPGVWQALKRVLLYGKLEIHDLSTVYHFSPSVLKPEPIEVNTNVILIGNNYIYSVLSNHEDDFNKIFKVKAEFDYEMDLNDKAIIEYAQIIKKLIENEGLLEFDKSALSKIVEYGARYAGQKKKLTTRFAYIADLARESSFWAKDVGAPMVNVYHVKEAYKASQERHGLSESKIQEMITEGNILIETTGSRVGQINGLAVYSNGRHSFGKPTRITASVGLGTTGILNVEREAGLSGKTHDKGLLIISGYFRETFGRRLPLSFTAGVVFEQGYGMIDGDSASITEICAIVSSLANIPLKQSLAITGSVNQKGDIQPIGGVNEKIEGFFDVCFEQGLNKEQGVIIPVQNVNDLMLKKEVVEAVEKGDFHIYSISKVEEAIELLTGFNSGARLKSGSFPKNTVYGEVESTLIDFHKRLKTPPYKKKTTTKKKK